MLENPVEAHNHKDPFKMGIFTDFFTPECHVNSASEIGGNKLNIRRAS